jgi:primase-polymerase (primpol)-like protein
LSYTELSPSGTGVHVLMSGTLPPGGRRRGHVELYDRDRYFTVTGNHLPGLPRELEARTPELERLHARLFPAAPAPRPWPTRRWARLDDAALLERAERSRDGARFAALYRGDSSGYRSQSEADLALCCRLAFWTHGDAARIDRLFRASGLMRAKWNDRADYRERTITLALEGAIT